MEYLIFYFSFQWPSLSYLSEAWIKVEVILKGKGVLISYEANLIDFLLLGFLFDFI